MKVIDIRIERLIEASWNVNRMDEDMLNHLKQSLITYGVVEPLVVRPVKKPNFEVLSGNQRLKVIRSMRFKSAPCVVANLNDQEAMLLAQALNGIKGEDDLARKGALLKKILSNVPEDKILSILPETSESLRDLSSLGQEDLAEHLQAWADAQAARLKHMQLQFTHQQLETVEEAVNLILPKAKNDSFENPNDRGNAIFLLCKFYLEKRPIE
jgi:ParB family transcriptional regulator, chromosome partitioning protein